MPRPAICPCNHWKANHTRTAHNGQSVHTGCLHHGCLCTGYGSGDYIPSRIAVLIPRPRVEAALRQACAA